MRRGGSRCALSPVLHLFLLQVPAAAASCPLCGHRCANDVQVRTERSRLPIVLLVVIGTMQPPHCCQVVSVVHHPLLAICGTGEATLMDGRFPKGALHPPRKVNHKENNEADRLPPPENGCGHHFTEINYLFLF